MENLTETQINWLLMYPMDKEDEEVLKKIFIESNKREFKNK